MTALLDIRQLAAAAPGALRKLDPRHQARNPVLFVVWVGSLLTTVLAVLDPTVFSIGTTLWLWATLLFANLAEAVAAPRIHHQWQPDVLMAEEGLSPDTLALLKQRGHNIAVKPSMGRTGAPATGSAGCGRSRASVSLTCASVGCAMRNNSCNRASAGSATGG